MSSGNLPTPDLPMGEPYVAPQCGACDLISQSDPASLSCASPVALLCGCYAVSHVLAH